MCTYHFSNCSRQTLTGAPMQAFCCLLCHSTSSFFTSRLISSSVLSRCFLRSARTLWGSKSKLVNRVEGEGLNQGWAVPFCIHSVCWSEPERSCSAPSSPPHPSQLQQFPRWDHGFRDRAQENTRVLLVIFREGCPKIEAKPQLPTFHPEGLVFEIELVLLLLQTWHRMFDALLQNKWSNKNTGWALTYFNYTKLILRVKETSCREEVNLHLHFILESN